MVRNLGSCGRLKNTKRIPLSWIWNHYTIKHHFSWHSLLFLLNQCTMTEPHCAAQLVFVLWHVGVVVSDSMRITACLIWHCTKNVDPIVCRTGFVPLLHPCAIPAFTTHNSHPLSRWGNMYWPICSTAAYGLVGGRYRVTEGLSFGAISQQYLWADQVKEDSIKGHRQSCRDGGRG